MKNFVKGLTILFVMLVMCAFNVSAQESTKLVVGVSPLTLNKGLRVKGEYVLMPRVTAAGLVTAYYGGNFPGFQVAAMPRFYFAGKAPQGTYAQFKVQAGFHSISEKIKESESKNSFVGVHSGLAIGHQRYLGKKFTLDINCGIRFILAPSGDIPFSNNRANSEDIAKKYLGGGPGSIFDGLISIGYRLF